MIGVRMIDKIKDSVCAFGLVALSVWGLAFLTVMSFPFRVCLYNFFGDIDHFTSERHVTIEPVKRIVIFGDKICTYLGKVVPMLRRWCAI